MLIGVSGGKDSVALTVGLALLREYIGFDYQLQAVTLDPQFGGAPGDYAPLADLMARYGVPYQVRRTDIGPVIFDQRQEKNPCALCAKMRRGPCTPQPSSWAATRWPWATTWTTPSRLLYEPVAGRADRLFLPGDLPVPAGPDPGPAHAAGHRGRGEGRRLRRGAAHRQEPLPADGATTREKTKEFVRERCRTDHAFRQKTLHALQGSGIDGWRPLHTGRNSFAVPQQQD